MNVSSSIEGYGLNLIQGGMKESILVSKKQGFTWNDTLKSGMRLMRDDLTCLFMPLQEEKSVSNLEGYGIHLIYKTIEIKEQVQIKRDEKVSSGSVTLQGYGLNLITPYIQQINKIEQESDVPTQTSYFTSYGLHLINAGINPNKEHILIQLEPTIQKENKLHESMTSNLDGYGLMLI